MDTVKMNFNTNSNLRIEFLNFCKTQRTTATSKFNEYMRTTLEQYSKSKSEAVTKKDKITNTPIDTWRDDLVRRG